MPKGNVPVDEEQFIDRLRCSVAIHVQVATMDAGMSLVSVIQTATGDPLELEEGADLNDEELAITLIKLLRSGRLKGVSCTAIK